MEEMKKRGAKMMEFNKEEFEIESVMVKIIKEKMENEEKEENEGEKNDVEMWKEFEKNNSEKEIINNERFLSLIGNEWQKMFFRDFF